MSEEEGAVTKELCKVTSDEIREPDDGKQGAENEMLPAQGKVN